MKAKILANGVCTEVFWRKFDVQHNFPEMEGRELKAGFVFDLSDGRSLEIK